MKLTPRDITRVALFASLITIASLILKFGGDVLVPFSMLPFMVMLTGALLGSRLGSLSVLVYVLLGLAGVPVFAKAPYGGIAYLLQPTAGFLAGYVLEAYIVGKLIEKKERPGLSAFILAMAAGIVFLYLPGIPYLYALVKFYLGRPFTFWKAIEIGLLPFIGLDLIKAVAAGVLARTITRRFRLHL